MSEHNHADIQASVERLLAMARRYGVQELDWSAGGLNVYIERDADCAAVFSAPQGDQTVSAAEEGLVEITSPVNGVFYRCPSPGEPPFVEVGDEVEVGSTLGVIEAMKVFSDVICEHYGVIAEVCVENAQAVSTGHVLFRIRPQGEIV